ncbi:hypothetical protein BDV33DRAFT_228383 [Aspergillus novoparasiticus]|uniref:Frag1/DRAM/Sfk1 family-domain-containing protein n=1 Tax=Aspergillus novoparasiticus TaxID=986946 RepID=A0A5N6EC48_9EURO|nr:hypothetical protein BDV33DRAFT_228383 [Aspergillus novoparasiticus]
MSTNPLFRCYDSAWFLLHVFILNIPPSRLFLFPALAGSLAHGIPQYPGQSNQHVAFISDIASFELKPLFLIGASITAVGFVTTVAAVHVVHYEPEFSLVKCPVTNNRNDNGEHSLTGNRSSYHSHCGHHDSYSEDEEDHETTRTLKLISLGSLSSYLPASLSTALIITEVFLGVAFISLTVPEEIASYRKAGILEWIIAFLRTIYLWLFCGFLDRYYIIDHCVRTNFDGHVPSVLYGPPIQRKNIEPPESLPGQIRNWDPERAHLIEGPSGGKYT